jgi:ribonuclease VapC
MVIDSSAVVAILLREPDAARFARAIAKASVRLMSAANLLETCIVVDNLVDLRTSRRLDGFIERGRIDIEPVTEHHVRIARQAYVDFGKGNHPAGPNFGECFAYALAKSTGEPLLFKGDDFSKTDIVPA